MTSDQAILVTGASGFAGRYVCAALRRMRMEHLAVDLPQCDITDAAAVAAVFRERKIGAVIHLAAVLPTASRSNPALSMRVNIVGSVNLMEAAAAAGAARFVLGSSMSVYGAESDGTPLSEDAPAQPEEVYGAAKRYVEIYGESLARVGRLRFTALRIANVVGPGARNTGSPWRSEIFENLGTNKPIVIPFPEHAVVSMVHAEELAEMFILLARRDDTPHSIYNTPAENWAAGELKRFIEALPGNPGVKVDNEGTRRPAPVAEGSRFLRDFSYQPLPLAERFRQATQSAR